MIDSSFSTAIGYIPSDEDRIRQVIMAKQQADHNLAKAGIPGASMAGLRAQPQQGGNDWAKTVKQGLDLYDAWQDSRSGGFDPYDTNFLVSRDNAIYGDTFPGGSFGIGSTSGDVISRHVPGSSSIQPDVNVAAGLGSDNNWWQGIKNIWNSGGN